MIRARVALSAAARIAAVIGGLLMLAAVIVTTASVIRGLFGRPILGDSEIVEMCLGIAVALCLAWGEMRGAHVIVDIFTARMAPRPLAWLEAVMRACVALVAALLAARIAVGAFDQWDRERATMFLELPYWVGFAGATIGLALWFVTASFVMLERLREARAA